MSEVAEQADASEAAEGETEVTHQSAAQSRAIDQALDEGDRDPLHTLPMALEVRAVVMLPTPK